MKYVKLFEEYYHNYTNAGYDLSYEINRNEDEIDIHGYINYDDAE